MKCWFTDVVGNRAKVQGMAEVKKSIMQGEVYIRAAIMSAETWDLQDLNVEICDAARERSMLSGTTKKL